MGSQMPCLRDHQIPRSRKDSKETVQLQVYGYLSLQFWSKQYTGATVTIYLPPKTLVVLMFVGDKYLI